MVSDIGEHELSPPQIGILTEDMYGALAVAGRLQQRGLTVQIARTDNSPAARAQAVVVDADLRSHAEDPVGHSSRWAQWLREQGCRRIEQRIEPTLRGNPSALLHGMVAGSGMKRPITIASTAYPSAGNVCIDGRQRSPVAANQRGSLVSQALFNNSESHVVDLDTINQGAEYVRSVIDERISSGIRNFVLDAANEAQVRTGAVVAEHLLADGYEMLTTTSGSWLRYYPDVGADGFVIVAVSSRNDFGDRQLKQVSASFGDEGVVLSSDEIIDSTDEHLINLLSKFRVIALESAWKVTEELSTTSATTGRAVRALLDASLHARNPCLGVVVSGGYTAAEVIDRLSVETLRPGNELEPLCPVVRISGGPFDGMAVISKGSFVGSDNTLVRLVRRLIGS